nr:ribonuclease H-like domain-containing protein [Tanacetum cinerariifolium]
MEAMIQEAICLDDEEGVDCLPNEEIFAELARMGYEKPSTKLTFYKAFFLSQWKFLIHTILQCMSAKRTSWNEFSSSMASAVDEEGDAHEIDETVNASNTVEGDVSAAHGEMERRNKVRVLKLRRLQRVGTSQRVETSDETVMDDVSNQGRMIAEVDADVDVVLEDLKEAADEAKEVAEDTMVDKNVDIQGRQAESQAKIYKIDLDHANKVLSMQRMKLSQLKSKKYAIITTVEAQVHDVTLTAAPARVVAAPSRRRKGVGKGILGEEPKPLMKKQQIKQDEQYARELHAELNKDIDWDEVIDHVKLKAKEDPAMKKYQALKRKPQTEAQVRKNMILYLKNVAGFKMDYFKGMSYDDIRPIFETKFNLNVTFLLKTKEQIEEEENRALQKINETLTERATKRIKLDNEAEELKRHLQIVPNKDDDVYTEATPPARKVPVVDYQIIEMNNKPYYKIIRADDTHQLYVSFLSLLINFDKEDLEALWSLVKERFSTTSSRTFLMIFYWLHLEQCSKSQIYILRFRRLREMYMVQQRSKDGSFWNHVMLNAVRLEVKEENLNGKETVGFNKTKVKYYNYHRRGHFARECKAPRNQGNRNRDAPTRNALVDTSTMNALVVQDGIGLKKGEGYHAVPSPYIGNYMPPRADLSFAGLDNHVFKSKVSETINSVPKIETNASKTSKDSLEKPKTVRSSVPLIEEWESYSKYKNVFKPKEVKKTVKPSLKKIKFVYARNTTVENENIAKKPRKFSQSPRGNKRNWNGLVTQKLGDGFEFKKKSCFVCGSINHLIKDCDFYENKMVLNNKGKVTSPKKIRLV